MKGGTLFSGIGAPEAAAPWIDWQWAAEVDAFASAVHGARFPHVFNLGDVNDIDWRYVEPVDIVVAGPPCQDHSVAGKRAGLGGDRGNLSLVCAEIIDAVDPAFALIENVPGWLNLSDNAFGTFLGRLVGHDAALVPGRGQHWTDAGLVAGPKRAAAWRVLDAQFFGVAQRRRRVFVLAVRGVGARACAEALFPFVAGMHGDIAPRRAQGERAARPVASCSAGGSGYRNDADRADDLIPALTGSARGVSRAGEPRGQDPLVVADPISANEARTYSHEGTNNFRLRNCVTYDITGTPATSGGHETDVHVPLRARAPGMSQHDTTTVVAVDLRNSTETGDTTQTLQSHHRSNSLNAEPTVMVEAFGGNRTSGPRDVGSALSANGFGRIDFETETFIVQNAERGQDQNGLGISGDGASYTLDGASQHAVAFESRYARNGRGGPEEVVPPLKAQSGQTGKGDGAPLTITGAPHANDTEARSVALLRALRDAVDEETLLQWCLGILAAFWPQEILRSGVHGSRFRRETQPRRGLLNVALSCAKTGAAWSVRDLWEAGCDGCSPPGWQPSEQLARQLGAHLSLLPYAPSPGERLMQDMQRAAGGLGLLLQTLSAVQEIRRSDTDQGQSVRSDQAGNGEQPAAELHDNRVPREASRERILQPTRDASESGKAWNCGGDEERSRQERLAKPPLVVRRLLPDECEALMGLPRGFTLVTYRGAISKDGPRYRALGNSMCIPVVSWLLQRVREVAR